MYNMSIFEPNYSKKIGRNVKYERRQKGLSVEDLSNFLDMPSSALRELEEGTHEVSIDDLLKIADFFFMPVDHFVSDNLVGLAGRDGSFTRKERLLTAELMVNNLNNRELDFMLNILRAFIKFRNKK